MTCRSLVEFAFAVQRVHQLQRFAFLINSRQFVFNPVHERSGFVLIPQPQKGVHDKSGIPNPGVAVVPVTAASNHRRQSKGRRGYG